MSQLLLTYVSFDRHFPYISFHFTEPYVKKSIENKLNRCRNTIFSQNKTESKVAGNCVTFVLNRRSSNAPTMFKYALCIAVLMV